MNEEDISQKIADYCNGNLSPAEEYALELYATDHPLLMDAIEGYIDHPSQIDKANHLKSLIISSKPAKVRGLKRLLPYAAAAIVLLITAISVYRPTDQATYTDLQDATADTYAEKIKKTVADNSKDLDRLKESTSFQEKLSYDNSTAQATRKAAGVTPLESPAKTLPAGSLTARQKTASTNDQVEIKSTTPVQSRNMTDASNTELPLASRSTSVGDITVGKAYKSTATAKAPRRKSMQTYYSSDKISISGSLALEGLSATKPWVKVWQDIDQLISQEAIDPGTATMQVRISKDQILITPMKNKEAISISGLDNYLQDHVLLQSEYGREKQWLIKLEIK